MGGPDDSPELTVESTVVARRSLASCDLEGEAVILNVGTGLYHGLNEAGSTVWKHLAEPVRVAALRDSLLDQYDVQPDRCLTDLLSVLRDLLEADLIEVCDADAA
jgi:hypothetical protein